MRTEADIFRLPEIDKCSMDVAGVVGGLSSLLGYPALVLSSHGWKVLHPNSTLGLEALWPWEKLIPGGQILCAGH